MNSGRGFLSRFLPPLAALVVGLLFAAVPSRAQNVQVDLSSTSNLCNGAQCFNVAGLFTTGTQFLGTSGMDNGNNCTPTPPYTNCPDAYSSTQLGLSTTTPPTLTPAALSIPFNFGTVNTANCGPSVGTSCTLDVVNLTSSGVTITLPSAQQVVYSTIVMLGTAVNGHHSGQVTANYTTGNPDVFPQTFSDWCGFGGNEFESIAVGPMNRINADGTLNGASCYLYAYTYTLDVSRALASITLKDEDGSGAMFALAITLKPPTYTIDGGIASPTSVAVGSSATATVTVVPQPGYGVLTQATVNLSCSITPVIVGDPPSAATAPTCSLNPTAVPVVNGQATTASTLTFTAASPSSTSMTRRNRGIFYALWLPLPGIGLVLFGLGGRNSKRRRLLNFLMLGLLLAAVTLVPGCVSTVHEGNVGTPPGQYTVTITGVDDNSLTQASNGMGTTNTVVVTVTSN